MPVPDKTRISSPSNDAKVIAEALHDLKEAVAIEGVPFEDPHGGSISCLTEAMISLSLSVDNIARAIEAQTATQDGLHRIAEAITYLANTVSSSLSEREGR